MFVLHTFHNVAVYLRQTAAHGVIIHTTRLETAASGANCILRIVLYIDAQLFTSNQQPTVT